MDKVAVYDTVGIFDYFHICYLRLFKNVKKLWNSLAVALQNNSCILKTKPDTNVMYITKERIEMIGAFKEINNVIIYLDY